MTRHHTNHTNHTNRPAAPRLLARTQLGRLVRRARTTLAISAAVIGACLAVQAPTASADQATWQDWTSMAAWAWTTWGYEPYVNYVETEPASYANGCANIYGTQYTNDFYWSTYWICSTPGSGVRSPLAVVPGYAASYNDSSAAQDIWSWVGYST